MFTLGRHQTKYIYPLLFWLLILLFFLFRSAGATESEPATAPAENLSARRGFREALESFNARAAADTGAYRDIAIWNAARDKFLASDSDTDDTDDTDDMDEQEYREDAAAEAGGERESLEQEHMTARSDFRERRLDILGKTAGFPKDSLEYGDLKEDLYQLDFLHTENERIFDRRFGDMEARHPEHSHQESDTLAAH